mgnify:CR=1 FL=1
MFYNKNQQLKERLDIIGSYKTKIQIQNLLITLANRFLNGLMFLLLSYIALKLDLNLSFI